MRTISSEERYRLLAKNAVEHAIIILDHDGVICEWTPGAQALLGWSADEAVGQSITMIFSDEDRATGASEAERATAKALGKSADVRWHLRKDGSTVFCDGVMYRLLDESSGRLLGFGKLLQEAYSLRQPPEGIDGPAVSEQRTFVAAVLESIENGVIACDRQGQLTFFNEAARKIHGMGQEPVDFHHWAEHYHLFRADGVTKLPLDEIPLYRALQGDVVESVAIVVSALDGSRRQVQVRGRAVTDHAGKVLGAVISMQDTTPEHAARAARIAAQREQSRRLSAEKSETRLRRMEEQLRLATEAAQLGIWTWNVELDRGTWENPRMHQIFNVPAGGEPINAATLMNQYLHPDDVDSYRQAIRATLQRGDRFYFCGRYYRLPGTDMRWLELTGMRQWSADAVVIIGTAEDITARKRDEAALREARLRFEATLSAAEVASWIWEISKDRVIGDRNLTRLFGLPTELAQSAPLSTYISAIHPDDLEHVRGEIEHTIASKSMYNATYRVKDAQGRYRVVIARGRAVFDADGRPEMLTGVTVDITRQTEVQQALRITDERYRTLISSMDQAFGIVQVVVDDQGTPTDYRFEEVNRAMELQSGLVEAAGKTIREMVPDIEQKWIDIYGQVALSRQPVRFVEHSAAMGYWWDVYATPIGEPDERRLAILFTDVTEKRRADEHLRQVAADLSAVNHRKTAFLATLAHELRNPLAPVRTGMDLLRLQGPNNAGETRILDMMDRQLNHMVHLIDDLMEVARINSGKIVLKTGRFDLREAVAHAIDSVAPAVSAARHRLQVVVPDQPVWIDADATRLAQVLGNLLTNAAKYTPEGGDIALNMAVQDGEACIDVSDSGIGIPLDEQANVFDMFSQVGRNIGHSQGGLGIGLALVRTLVEMHGGSVTVRSPGPGLGSTFTVKLTGCSVGASTAVLPRPAPSVAGGELAAPLRVLIADDNADAASVLSTLLETTGHTTYVVGDGLSAVGKIVELRPDLALIDIGMPGLNGYEVARKIRRTAGLETIKLIALTGWGGEQDRDRSREAGFDTHMVKPIGVAELQQLLILYGDRRP